MEELEARGSQDLMGKGPLFRRGSCCGECVFLKNKTQYEKIYPQASQIIVWKDFLLLPGFCSGVTEGKISWDIREWLRNE